MPIYHYKCECGFDQEVYHSIKEPTKQQCPACKNPSLYIVIDTIPYGAVKEVKTVGQLAEKNSRNMGKEQVQMKMDSDGTTEKIKNTEKMREAMKLGSLTPEKKRKYIETGKL